MAGAEKESSRLTVEDWVLLAAVSGVAVWLAMVATLHARSTGLTWTGTDGVYIGDQMQYLGWVSDASRDLLIGNPFQIGDTAEHFLHPGLAVSGVLHRLGLSTAAAYLLWKPVAVATLFFGARAYVRRLITDRAHRAVALALALLACMPMPGLYEYLGIQQPAGHPYFGALASDMFPGLYLWGYPFTAIAVGLMPISLLLYERARHDRRIGLAPATVLLCAWLQPWQGATLVVIVLGSELWRARTHPGELHPRLAAVFTAAAALPLAYYALLSRIDTSWEHAGEVNRGGTPWSVSTVAIFFVPVALVTALELRRPVDGFQTVALRLWPIAALTVFWTISYSPFGTFPLHSVQGLSIPVAVLAVRGVTTLDDLGGRRAVVAGLAVLVLACLGPTLVAQLRSGANIVAHPERLYLPLQPYFLLDDEREAMEHLADDPDDGGVLARVHLGQTVPGLTGRRTWVGIASWTPDYAERVERAEELFSGALSADEARTLVDDANVGFLLDDCGAEADLEALLGDRVASVHRFGCAAVYELS